MKATFGGVEVEGTPEEIANLMRLTQGIKVEPITAPVVVPQPYPVPPVRPWWQWQPWGYTWTNTEAAAPIFKGAHYQ